MGKGTIITVITGVLAMTMACNKPSHSTRRKNFLTNTDTPKEIPKDKLMAMTAKAAYSNRSLDVLIVQEAVDYSFSGGRDRVEKLQRAAKSLGARLRYAPYDIRVAFAFAYPWADDMREQANDPNKGELDAREGATVLTRSTPNLNDVLVKKFSMPDKVSYPYAQQYQPLTALKRMVEAQVAKPESDRSLVRKNAFLSILFIGEMMEKQEGTLPEELATYLDGVVGAGSWSVSALSLTPVEDKTGCPYDDNAFTPSDASNSPRLIVKLQQRAKGQFLSLCAPSFLSFFDRFLLEAGGMRYFPVELSSKAMWDNLEVKIAGRPFYGWRYEVGSTSLLLPRLIPQETALSIRFEKDDGSRPNVAKDQGAVTEKKLTPEEQKFMTDVNPIFERNCATSTCHGDGSTQQIYVGRYDNVKNGKDNIMLRIQKPDDDPQKMPRGTPMTAEEKTSLLNYLKELK